MNYPKHRYTGEKPWMNSEWLYDQYVVQDRSSQEIADAYGCKRNTIQQWLAKYKISKPNVKRVHKRKRYQEYDYLYHQYVVLHRPIKDIASDNGVSYDTIRTNLVANGITISRTHYTKRLTSEDICNIKKLYCEDKISINKIAQLYAITRKRVRQLLARFDVQLRNLSEAQFALTGREMPQDFFDGKMLYEMHWGEGMSCGEIGDIFGVDAGTIRRQMHRLGVKTKTNAESKIGLMTGANHPNWRGGRSSLKVLLREYFDVNQAPVAAKRDNYTCQLCGATHTILHVHHIIPFAKIVNDICDKHPELDPNSDEGMQELYNIITGDERFLDINNLITYCASCHRYKIHKYQKRKIISSQASQEEGSETIPQGSTP